MNKLSIIARAGTMLAAVSALTVAATFAALTSTATLTNNTISSASADLQVNNTDNAGTFGATDTGFTFDNLVPGAAYSAAQHFSLKNNGSANLTVTVYAVGATVTGTIDKSKVHVKFTNADTANAAEYTMAELESLVRDVPGVSGAGSLAASGNEENAFSVQVKLDADAVTGGSASLSGFDLVFTGSSF